MYLVHFLILSIFINCSEDADSRQLDDPINSDTQIAAENDITINASVRTKKNSNGSGGVVACWLMDSDIERPRKTSFATAMKDMGVKFIRFPYGHLADNYLWDADGDWGNTLTPKVSTFSQAPGSWDWAVDQTTGEFIKDMDFDEYIAICKDTGAEPMVVVNILSYKYENGPTYEHLKETAVEWVRYANITKDYKVKRWALGNEVDHHPDLISQDEYKALYSDFATAMKEVDPSIMIGPGLLGNWHAAMLNHDPDNIDFICAHNYLFTYDWRNQNYEGWKNSTDIMVHNVEKCQNAVKNSSVSDIEIHVTEMNSYPWKDKSDNDDLFRSLAYGEMVLNACSFKNVVATYVWNTHGPWGGENNNASYNVLDLDNNREPRGDIIKLINENLLDYLLNVPRVKGFLRIYASVSENNKKQTIFLINKNNQQEKLNLTIQGFEPESGYSMHVYTGSDAYDNSPSLTKTENLQAQGNNISIELSPVSLSIIQLTNKE